MASSSIYAVSEGADLDRRIDASRFGLPNPPMRFSRSAWPPLAFSRHHHQLMPPPQHRNLQPSAPIPSAGPPPGYARFPQSLENLQRDIEAMAQELRAARNEREQLEKQGVSYTNILPEYLCLPRI